MKPKRITLFLAVMVAILILVTGCSNSDKGKDLASNPYGTEIIIKDNKSTEEASELILEHYLNYLKEENISERARIKDYSIENVVVDHEENNEFTFIAEYSILPVSKDYVLAGSAEPVENGWVRFFHFFKIEKSDSTYSIQGIGTSP